MGIVMYIYIFIMVIMSLIAFGIYGYDKRLAMKNKMRIKEKYLLQTAILGGAIGALIGRILFKHKTNKIYFTIVIGAALILEVVTLIVLIVRR